MKNLSDDNEHEAHLKREQDIFRDAVAWKLPEITGNIINQRETAPKRREIDEVKEFEARIRKRMKQIQDEKDHPTFLTVEQIEQIQKQAYDDAYNAAYEETIQKAIADSESRIQQVIDEEKAKLSQKATQLQQMFDCLNEPMKLVDQQMEQQLTEMVFHLARSLVSEELLVNTEQVKQLLLKTVSLLPISTQHIKIKINPQDQALLEEQGVNFDDHDWSIEVDNSVTSGSCKVDSSSGRVEISLEEKVKQMAHQLYIDLENPLMVADDTITEIGVNLPSDENLTIQMDDDDATD